MHHICEIILSGQKTYDGKEKDLYQRMFLSSAVSRIGDRGQNPGQRRHCSVTLLHRLGLYDIS